MLRSLEVGFAGALDTRAWTSRPDIQFTGAFGERRLDVVKQLLIARAMP